MCYKFALKILKNFTFAKPFNFRSANIVIFFELRALIT